MNPSTLTSVDVSFEAKTAPAYSGCCSNPGLNAISRGGIVLDNREITTAGVHAPGVLLGNMIAGAMFGGGRSDDRDGAVDLLMETAVTLPLRGVDGVGPAAVRPAAEEHDDHADDSKTQHGVSLLCVGAPSRNARATRAETDREEPSFEPLRQGSARWSATADRRVGGRRR